MGFTRDRRIANKLDPHNQNIHNQPTSSLSFFLAPTQSNGASSIGFTRADDELDCLIGDGWRSMKVDTSTTVGEKKFGDMCKEFMHVAVSVDIEKNNINIYLDNVLMSTSSVTTVFGTELHRPVNLPSFKQDNSFEYSNFGPRLDTFFTPWILGGGYTDGMS